MSDYSKLCIVSVVRSGDILLEGVRQIAAGAACGHVLVQRDETHPEKIPTFYYKKFPEDVAKRTVMLVDPMIGTSGSAQAAIRCLLQAGVEEHNILFLNVVACPEGIRRLQAAYPNVKMVTAAVDPHMNSHKYIIPGLGDFGDRYYRTGGDHTVA